MALPKDRNQDTPHQRACRILRSRAPREVLAEKQRDKLAVLEERLSQLMSQRAFEEEVLAELLGGPGQPSRAVLADEYIDQSERSSS
jgi:hypothetical protein